MATKINVRNFWHHFWTQFCDALSHGAIHFVRSVSSSTLKMGAFYWLLKNFSQYNFAIIVHLPLGGVIGKYYLLVDAVVHCSQHLCQSCQRGPPGGLEGSVLVILDCKLTLVTFWKYGFTYFDFNLCNNSHFRMYVRTSSESSSESESSELSPSLEPPSSSNLAFC